MAKGRIEKRGENKWYLRIFLGRDPVTGKRKDYNKMFRGTKKEADAYLRKLLTQRDSGTLIDQTNMNLAQYLDQWLDQVARQRVREKTYLDYGKMLRRYFYPAIGNRPLAKITPLEIQKIYNDLHDRGLAPRTIRYAHTVLHSALKQAVLWRFIQINPADQVQLPRQVRREMRSLTPEEAERFLNAAAEDRFGLVFVFALTTGMRPGEYLALQWKDLDLKTGVATVRRSLYRKNDGSWIFQETKTSRSRRSIPLPATVVEALKRHHRRQAVEILAAGPKYENLDLVFAAGNGRPIGIRNLTRRHFKPILKKAGLPDIRLYDLRHSCATILMAAGENPKVVSERLGHSTINLTLDTYSHVLPTMQRQATEKLEEMLFSGTEQR